MKTLITAVVAATVFFSPVAAETKTTNPLSELKEMSRCIGVLNSIDKLRFELELEGSPYADKGANQKRLDEMKAKKSAAETALLGSFPDSRREEILASIRRTDWGEKGGRAFVFAGYGANGSADFIIGVALDRYCSKYL